MPRVGGRRMTPEEMKQPLTRGDIKELRDDVKQILVGLHGDGTKDNQGLFHRVDKIEEKFGSIMKNIGAVWSAGITVATFVFGNWIWEKLKH